MIGAALLYAKTGARNISEMLITQIGRKPLNDKAVEREVYALSAGMALGIVNLNCGDKKWDELDERLIRYVEGGKVMDVPKSMVPLALNADSIQCSTVKETDGTHVNVQVTQPGGLMALLLIHLRTNNQFIASKVTLPTTFNALEQTVPQNLVLKILTRNLILWDSIEPTAVWIQNQIPDLISQVYNSSVAETYKQFSA